MGNGEWGMANTARSAGVSSPVTRHSVLQELQNDPVEFFRPGLGGRVSAAVELYQLRAGDGASERLGVVARRDVVVFRGDDQCRRLDAREGRAAVERKQR